MIRVLMILLALPVALATLVAVTFLLVNRTNGTLVSSGETRRYLLYVPENYDPAVPTALVISNHGFAEWPAHQRTTSRWNDLADRHGVIVVYPAGTGFPMRWRASGPRTETESMADVTFISDLIDKLQTEYAIDPRRIYANGLSNGGGMSVLLACELSERIAAIGSVAGAYLLPWDECTPSRSVPVIAFHGTADPIVPYGGGASDSFDVPFPRVPEWVGEMARRNGCTGTPRDLSARGDASGVAFTGCVADVEFYTITGGGHTWPGGVPLPKFIAGYTTDDIDATEVMWAFFQQHPLGAE